MVLDLLTVSLRHEEDLVAARTRARQIAGLVRFDAQEQTRIATAVSEIARNAFRYARGGRVEFAIRGRAAPQLLSISVIDEGPGIPALAEILAGRYHSATGMGMGIVGARRLVDRFEISCPPSGGTIVAMQKILPRKAGLITASEIERITRELAASSRHNPLEEVQQQNQELLRALDELRKRQDELEMLNRELEDTNRGVVALYAELDERADYLRRADEIKTRFLSNMSHEFRTPVNSVIALARILLSRSDGDLTTEQEKQVTFIRKAAESLLELVNDLLDLAKVEAGKIVIRPVQFEIANLFGALRGMLRPLLVGDSVNLVFEEPDDLPPMFTDEAKVSQILRNFISNALKFTERGEVRVSSNLSQGRDAIVFSVSDTGIGIALEDQERIFQEFSQLDNPVQKRVRGTGLGLPLSKKFADLLGGHISVESRLGHGSTFSVEVPLLYRPSPTTALQAVWEVDPHRVPVLVVEDEPDALLICQKLMKGSNFQPLAARSLFEARQVLSQVQPRAIILDILLSGEDAWGFLAELKRDPRTAPISILVVTETDDEAKAVALGADAYRAKPLERKWLLDTLVALTGPAHSRQALIVDDDEVSRYLIRQAMLSLGLPIVEAESGIEGLRRARENRPAVILLDLIMPGLSGFEVLDQLKADTLTSDIPVIIVTASAMGPGQIHKLSGKTAGVVTKAELSGDALSALVIRATSISQPASHLA